MTPPKAVLDASQAGVWVNHRIGENYHLTNARALEGVLWRRKVLYDFEQNFDRPVTWKMADGTRIIPCPCPGVDGMSVPYMFQPWVPREMLAGILHDGIYRFGGAFVAYNPCAVPLFRQINRAQADAVLRAGVQADPVVPVGCIRAFKVWTSVRVFAPFRYHEWQIGDDVPVWPEAEKPDVDDQPLEWGV